MAAKRAGRKQAARSAASAPVEAAPMPEAGSVSLASPANVQAGRALVDGWQPGQEPVITGEVKPPTEEQKQAAAAARERDRVARILRAKAQKLLPPASPLLRIPPTPASVLKHALMTRDLARAERADCENMLARLGQLALQAGLIGGAADLLIDDELASYCLNAQERELLPLMIAAKARNYGAPPDAFKPDPPGLREVKAQVKALEGGTDARLDVLEAQAKHTGELLERIAAKVLAEPAEPRKPRRR